jgi:hypothetical protein
MANPSPTITFRVNLELLETESIGPNTNLVNPHILHPDMYQNSPDKARLAKAHRKSTRSTFLPARFGGQNRQLQDGDEFTEYGLQALYLRDNYARGYAPGDRAFLEVVE